MHSPGTEKIQYVVEGEQKCPSNKKAYKKEEKTVIDQIWQSQTKESAVSLRLAKIKYEVFSLMFQAQNLMLPNVGFLKKHIFLLPKNYILSLLVFRRDLCKFKTYHFTKYFMKLGTVMCGFVFWEERDQSEFQFFHMNFCSQKEKEMQ